MSLANTLRAMAFAEAPTLGAAIALIAKRRNDLAAALRAGETRAMPVETEGAAAARALRAIAADPASGHALDRKA